MNPVQELLAEYVLDVLGELPAERAAAIEALDLPKVLAVEAVGWRAALRTSLGLSDTFPIAVLDRWVRLRDRSSFEPELFAADFAAAYLEEGSRVDVWGPGELAAARRRIAESPEGARRLLIK